MSTKPGYEMFLKVTCIIILFVYANFTEISVFTNKLDALLTLSVSIWLLIKSRKNAFVSLIAFFLLYCNYSIIVGEYLVGGDIGVPMYEVKTIYIYGVSIRILLLFTFIITAFYNNTLVAVSNFKLVPKSNLMIFYGLLVALIYILVFGVSRSELISYNVRITSMYEYSTLLFMFAYYFSGNSLLRKTLFTSLLGLFILQDVYYGGRITSVQLIILFLVTMRIEKLSYRFILTGGFIGIVLNGIVGVYRGNYSLDTVNIVNIVRNLKNSFFVFNTPVFAYYASATHVAAAQIESMTTRLDSLFAFIVSIFFGSRFSNNELSDVTSYVSKHDYPNVGGGMIPTHFYFWLGWPGVIIISMILVIFLNKFNKVDWLKNDYQKLCALTVIVTVPRWYLYSPLSLFRPILLISILYLIFLIAHRVMMGAMRKQSRKLELPSTKLRLDSQ